MAATVTVELAGVEPVKQILFFLGGFLSTIDDDTIAALPQEPRTALVTLIETLRVTGFFAEAQP